MKNKYIYQLLKAPIYVLEHFLVERRRRRSGAQRESWSETCSSDPRGEMRENVYCVFLR